MCDIDKGAGAEIPRQVTGLGSELRVAVGHDSCGICHLPAVLKVYREREGR